MAENSGIEWTHHTANYWIGCTKVQGKGPSACDHCYAERDWDHRYGRVQWGPHGDRSGTKHDALRNRLRNWNNKAAAAGERRRVFVNSLSDIADNHKSIQQEWRSNAEMDIREFRKLDFLLLTKRPQNIEKLYPEMVSQWPANAWMGCTVENRDEMLRRGDKLAEIGAQTTFWSCEPLLGDLGIIPIEMMPSWIIIGGESGPNFRKDNPDWYRSIVDQCEAVDVPVLFKQWGGKNQSQIKALGRALDGVVHDGYPTPLTA